MTARLPGAPLYQASFSRTALPSAVPSRTSSARGRGLWVVPLRAGSPARRRLVVFPHAGAGPERYATLLERLPGDVEVLGVTLPGRAHRADAEPGTSWTAVLAGVARELRHLGTGVPTVFYGHSLGGLLALAAAHAGAGRCDGLVLSCSPPGRRGLPGGPDGITDLRPADLFARHRLPLDAPAGLIGRPRVLAYDLLLAAELLGSLDGMGAEVPLTALVGSDDHLVPAAVLPLWADFARAGFRGRVVPGGHFFPFAPRGEAVLLEELTSALVRTAARSPRRGRRRD